ncbi:MAG TPA: RelA/SpoT family protein [Chromatiaceae bacterium]|nr:RelA/SpoT family protein [Chromatiaceae bacterium]
MDEAPRLLISDLLAYLESYLTPEQVREVYRAYLFGAEAHLGQLRQTGEPYIYHPIAVARILGEMRMDHRCLMAALLHDVLEDTPNSRDQLVTEFGEEIAALVDGVSKLTAIDFKSRAEAQAASFRKMMLAMTQDIRVILIKLADRLHNMRTLGIMTPQKCRRVSRETLEIYAPIANRLGINNVRLELEELGFRHHWPWRYRILERAVQGACGSRQELVAKVETAMRRRLSQEGITAEVKGRRKHLYSIYLKMREKQRSFDDVVDVYAFRIVVDRVDTCYRVLGLIHNLYKPKPGRFKDYIAIPKSNGYQSLHTVLAGPGGAPIEVQIRTADMQRLAEAGIAAHWMYKSGSGGGGNPQALAENWLKDLLEMQRNAGDPKEFLEHVKVDLFPDEVYVFTPKGRIMVLPKGATLVDFAYAIHSDVGNTCVAGRVDRRLAPLRSALRSGQTVEIINAPTAHPNPAWLNYVVSSKARSSIRTYLRNLERQEARTLGERLLESELAAHQTSLAQIPAERLAAYLADANLANLDALLAEVGLGNRLAALVARRLLDGSSEAPARPQGTPQPPLAIKGTEGMVVTFGRCCRPIPGDEIAALFSPGKGLVVHRRECRNLGDVQAQRDNWVDVQWAEHPTGDFTSTVRVEVGNRRGTLATVASAIAELGSNIENVQTRERDGMTSNLEFTLSVRSRQHLAQIMRRLRRLSQVERIVRLVH